MTYRTCASAVSFLIGCGGAAATHVALADDAFLKPNTLVISSSTYVNSQGAVATLAPGTQLPGTGDTLNSLDVVTAPGSTASAVSGNNYVTVWSNEGSGRQLRRDLAHHPDRHRAAERPRVRQPGGSDGPGRDQLLLQVRAGVCTTSATNGGHLVFVGYGLRRRRRAGRIQLRCRAGPGSDQSGHLRFRHRVRIFPHHRGVGRQEPLLVHPDSQLRRQQWPRGPAGFQRPVLHRGQRQQWQCRRPSVRTPTAPTRT